MTAVPGPIANAAWLSDHRQGVVLADVRWYADGRDGRRAYLDEHIAGAVWLDVDHDLSGPPSLAAGRHPIPAPEAFAAALGQRGIGNDDIVIGYDDMGGPYRRAAGRAARRRARSVAMGAPDR
jgi:thiosulfate/3-mercaptopyruvate sulfurtransferase